MKHILPVLLLVAVIALLVIGVGSSILVSSEGEQCGTNQRFRSSKHSNAASASSKTMIPPRQVSVIHRSNGLPGDTRLSQSSTNLRRPNMGASHNLAAASSADGASPPHSTSIGPLLSYFPIPMQVPEGPYRKPQPAAWVDLGDHLPPDSQRDLAIQMEAERLAEEFGVASLSADLDSDTDQTRWQEAVTRSDRLFRQRFGARLWMAHHVQAHHLAATPTKIRE